MENRTFVPTVWDDDLDFPFRELPEEVLGYFTEYDSEEDCQRACTAIENILGEMGYTDFTVEVYAIDPPKN